MGDYNGDLKVLSHKIDGLTKKIEHMDDKIDPVCDMVIRHDEKIKTAEKEIDRLRRKSDIWNSLNSLGVLVTGTISALWKG